MKAILAHPRAYEIFNNVVLKFGRARDDLMSLYVPYKRGRKILDLGCGPGSSAQYFHPEDYLGIDIDERYIEYAKRKYPSHKFEKIDFNDFDISSNAIKYDIILIWGLLHHLDNNVVSQYLSRANQLLNKDGMIVSVENCIHDKQSRIKKKIILLDRGKFIRSPQEYVDIFSMEGFKTEQHLSEKSLIIPYTMLITQLTINHEN